MDFIIATDQGPFYYHLFYRLSLLAVFLIFLWEGRRRGHPLATLLLFSAVCTFFVIIGSKLSALGPEDWRVLWETGALPASIGKSSVGALVFGWIGIGLAQRWLRFRHSVMDLYVIAMPVALILQRVGCLLVGCCFGAPTTLPWAVQYGHGHHAWAHHAALELIPSTAEHSLAIHPVPLYFILAYLLVIVLVLRFGKRLQANGSKALLALALIFAFRFFVEFFRDPFTNHGWEGLVLGLKKIQLIALALSVVFAGLAFIRERREKTEPENYQAERHLLPHLALFVGLLFAVSGLHSWFDISETISLQSKLLFAAGAMAWLLFYRATHPRLRWATLGTLALSVVFMGQTYVHPPADSTGQEAKAINRFTFGLLGGTNEYSFTTSTSSSSCMPAQEEVQIGPSFRSGGLQYERLWEQEPGHFIGLGLGIHFSSYDRRIVPRLRADRIVDFGLLSYAIVDQPEFMLKVGLQAGSLTNILGREQDEPVIFLLSLRLGPRNKIFLDGGYGDDAPYGVFASAYKVGAGLGSGLFGAKHHHALRFGLTNIGADRVFYINPEIQVWRFRLLPTARFGKVPPNFGLSLGYYFEDQ